MAAFRKASRGWVVSAACLLLLFQLFGGFTVASHAAALPQIDAFGNVLCLGGHPGEKPSGKHVGPAGCCTLGCQGFASLAALPDSGPGIDNPPVAISAMSPPATEIFYPGPSTRPGNPRAPPLAA